MCKNLRILLVVPGLAVVLFGLPFVHASANEEGANQQSTTEEATVIAIRKSAQWCKVCESTKHSFDELKNQLKTDPVLFVTLDLTDEYSAKQAVYLSSVMGIPKTTADKAIGVGVLLIVDARTKQPISKTNLSQNVDQMMQAVKKALASVTNKTARACSGRPNHSALREELLAMSKRDQSARFIGRHGGCNLKQNQRAAGPKQSIAETDYANTNRMKQIIDEIGWPVPEMVGADASRAAWLLVQHADHDVKFQRTCLALMEEEKVRDQLHLPDIAYLTDRVLVNSGKPQLYGTQFHEVDGKLQPRPIKNPEQVDLRRTSMQLTTLREYIDFMHT